MILAVELHGRSPDFLNPGLPAVGAGLMTADENSTFAIREDGEIPNPSRLPYWVRISKTFSTMFVQAWWKRIVSQELPV